jgi:hypothetical protein
MNAPFEPRRVFHDRTLLYLFSYDIEVDMDLHTLGFVPGGVRANVAARRNMSRVYHVMRDQTVIGIGSPAISGSLEWGGDWLYWREDDVEFSQVRLAIKTDDGDTIHGAYKVITYLGIGGFRRVVGEKEKIGSEDQPVEFRVMTTPRFETTSPTYRWLNDLQCVGFGRVQMIRSEFRRISYDVYGLT